MTKAERKFANEAAARVVTRAVEKGNAAADDHHRNVFQGVLATAGVLVFWFTGTWSPIRDLFGPFSDAFPVFTTQALIGLSLLALAVALVKPANKDSEANFFRIAVPALVAVLWLYAGYDQINQAAERRVQQSAFALPSEGTTSDIIVTWNDSVTSTGTGNILSNTYPIGTATNGLGTMHAGGITYPICDGKTVGVCFQDPGIASTKKK